MQRSPQRRPSPNARRRALRYGFHAETLAALWLMAKGYRVLARRYSVKGGEIDLVVVRGDTVAFVEVKARADYEAAAHALVEGKLDRIRRAARAWVSRNGWAARCTLRGDAVLIAPWRLPRHAPGAYTLDFA